MSIPLRLTGERETNERTDPLDKQLSQIHQTVMEIKFRIIEYI